MDEVVGHNEHLFDPILKAITGAPTDHLSHLRLVLFSRPHADLGRFRTELERRYAGFLRGRESPQFWLARPDRETAERIVGPERFSEVIDVIQQNNLQPVAGYPVVLRYLARYTEVDHLDVIKVWRGILTALLGDRGANPRVQFVTEPRERFEAACRMAAVLSLTRQDTIREYSPADAVPTIGTLFDQPGNRLLAAARDASNAAVFVQLPEQGALRFAQRNVQDWFTAFAMEGLPLPSLRSALIGPDGNVASDMREAARLVREMTNRPEVCDEIDRLSGGILLPSDAVGPTLDAVLKCLDQLENLAQNAPWGVRLEHEELARLRVDGLGAVLAGRLLDPSRPHRAKRLLIDVAEATDAHETVDPTMELVRDPAQHDELRIDAMGLVVRLGGNDHLRELASPIAESAGDSEIEQRLRGRLIRELLDRQLWERWRAATHAPPVDPDVIDHRSHLLQELETNLTAQDARQLVPSLQTLYERHADHRHPNRWPKILDRVVDLIVQEPSPNLGHIDRLVKFTLGLIEGGSNGPTAWSVATRLGRFPRARRQFYEHDVEAERTGQQDLRMGLPLSSHLAPFRPHRTIQMLGGAERPSDNEFPVPEKS